MAVIHAHAVTLITTMQDGMLWILSSSLLSFVFPLSRKLIFVSTGHTMVLQNCKGFLNVFFKTFVKP